MDVRLSLVIRRPVYGICQILYGIRVEGCPDTAHLAVRYGVPSSVVRGVPASHELLCETVDVVSVYLHHAQVTVGLQLCSGQLCIRVDFGGFHRCMRKDSGAMPPLL